MSTPLTILYGGHRKVMRIGANDNMSTVLQMSCQEFGLDAKSPFVLKHKRVVVDLSQPFRFTGIPQNATVELAEDTAPRSRGAAGSRASGAQVRVAMKIPSGGRVQGSFSPETTLLGLLQGWAGRGEIDAGVLQQGPSLQFMRTAYKGEELERTSLRSIGLVTGSAMFTLSLSSPTSSASASPASIAPISAATGGGSDAIGAKSASESGELSPRAQEEADIAKAIALSAADTVMDTSDSVGGDKLKEDVVQAPADAPTGASADAPAPAVEAFSGGVTTEMTNEMDVDGGSGVDDQQQQQQQQQGGSRVEDGQQQQQQQRSDEAQLPTMGIVSCRAALEEMTSKHFDTDSAACVITLAKMMDNVVHRPDDSRTRQIRCANSAFQQKVGRIAGGIAFLEGVGFVSKNEESPSRLLGGAGAGSSLGAQNRMLVLPPNREDPSLLKEARGLLTAHADTLGVPRDRMPQPPRPAPARPSPATNAQGMAFDPYKPFMTSTAPTPKGAQEQSLTEKRLQELQAKRDGVVAGGVPERNIQVTLPSQAAAAAAAALAAASQGNAGEGAARDFGRGSSSMAGGGSEGRGGDGGLIAKKVARQMAERKKREDVPFQTKAMREIERLQKATVYRTTVIKIQFPDRVVIQATFASTESVKDLAQLVQGCLGDSHGGRQFELYVSPPRSVLKESSSLSDAGLVPAALVYVSWKAVPPAGEAEGAYLKPEFTTDASSGAGSSQVARPVGVALDAGRGSAEESTIRRGSGGARGSGSGSSGGKRTGKPSWLKIN